jgi:hypothetical protein
MLLRGNAQTTIGALGSVKNVYKVTFSSTLWIIFNKTSTLGFVVDVTGKVRINGGLNLVELFIR